jgi:hypothetical protein
MIHEDFIGGIEKKTGWKRVSFIELEEIVLQCRQETKHHRE